MTSPALNRRFPTLARRLGGLVFAGKWDLRRLRMSVRSLMVVVLVVGIVLGWIEYRVHIQRDAVAAIQRAGGNVTYAWDWEEGNRPQKSQPAWQRWLMMIVGPEHFRHVIAVGLDSQGDKVDDALMAHVGNLERLRDLSLFNTAVTDDGLSHLRNLIEVRTLRLNQTAIRATGLVHLKRMVKLQELTLPNVPVSDADLAHLAGLTRLLRLSLSGQDLTNTGLAYVGSMTQLCDLSLRNTRITSLEPIRGLTNLISLDLVGSPIDDAGLKPIRGFQKLELLLLGQTKVTDPGMAEIASRPALRFLDLDRTSVTEAGVARLRDLPHLGSLNLYETQVTDQGLARLAGELNLPALRRLIVAGPGVTLSGVEALRGKLPGVHVIGSDLNFTKRPANRGQ